MSLSVPEIRFLRHNTEMISHAPSFDVFGSFFPVWMPCIAAAVLLTIVSRFLLIRMRLEGEMRPRVIFYPCMVALFACAIWFLLFK